MTANGAGTAGRFSPIIRRAAIATVTAAGLVFASALPATSLERGAAAPSAGAVTLTRAVPDVVTSESGHLARVAPARQTAGAVDLPAVKARGLYAFDLTTGQVLDAASPNRRTRIASVSKLMTVLMCYEAVAAGTLTWSQKVRINSRAVSGLSADRGIATDTMRLKYHASYSVRSLLELSLVESNNAAVTALGEAMGGSNAKFLAMENQRAAQLGMTNSTFISISGLDNKSLVGHGLKLRGTSKRAGNLLSAKDVGTLVTKLLTEHPEVLQITRLRRVKVHGHVARSTNLMLPGAAYAAPKSLGVDGLKTGSTTAAGACVVVTAQPAGRDRVVIVVLHAPSAYARWTGARKLLKAIYQDYAI
jgi:D-alanyl-D-alanine carboxypeptidase (penicillin-binding protein 5/6)